MQNKSLRFKVLIIVLTSYQSLVWVKNKINGLKKSVEQAYQGEPLKAKNLNQRQFDEHDRATGGKEQKMAELRSRV